MGISLDLAESVIAAARKAAGEAGVVVSLAVVETGGELVAFARMDGATQGTGEAAKRKAEAAIALGFDTVHMTATDAAGQPLFGGPQATDSHALVPNGGGIVIRVGGAVIGGLGVSGAAASIVDHRIGSAAVEHLN
ncbi:heme-binding protein [Nocardia sp. N2S4-5]|uniref:heme-binding protein n=1 Tax=Nocardia sp. N2S4-5 TaxID=3351565 RepID=UPI0037D6544B